MFLPISGSNIRVGSPGNFEAELRLPRHKLKHPRQSTEAEFCHLFLQILPTLLKLPIQILIYRGRI